MTIESLIIMSTSDYKFDVTSFFFVHTLIKIYDDEQNDEHDDKFF
jgi:hypothetical protein